MPYKETKLRKEGAMAVDCWRRKRVFFRLQFSRYAMKGKKDAGR